MKTREPTPHEWVLTNPDFAPTHIWSRLQLNDLAHLGMVNTFFQPFLLQARKVKATELVQLVVYGDQAKAKKLLKVSPSLLLISVDEVLDYSFRPMKNVTAFQAALRCQDVEMWKMILPYFDKLANGQQAKAAQFNEEFPVDGMAINQDPFDFSTIVDVITRSKNADITAMLNKKQNDSTLCQKLNQFRKDFTARSLADKHFNPQHLLKAFAVYDENHRLWSGKQRRLFWRQVIGYVQRYLPACYAQAFSQSIWNVVQNNHPLRRSFELKYDKGCFFYPLSSESSFSGVGYDYVAPGLLYGADFGGPHGAWGVAGSLAELCQRKQNSLENLRQRLQQPTNEVDLTHRKHHCQII